MKRAALLTKGSWDFCCHCSMHTLPSGGQGFPGPRGYPPRPCGPAVGEPPCTSQSLSLVWSILLCELLCSFHSLLSLSMPYNIVLIGGKIQLIQTLVPFHGFRALNKLLPLMAWVCGSELGLRRQKDLGLNPAAASPVACGEHYLAQDLMGKCM